jgi:hypothetical protein
VTVVVRLACEINNQKKSVMSQNSKLNGIALAGLLLLGTTFSSFASLPEGKENEKSSNVEMKVQVINQNGEIVLTDVVAENDPILQYNM